MQTFMQINLELQVIFMRNIRMSKDWELDHGLVVGNRCVDLSNSETAETQKSV